MWLPGPSLKSLQKERNARRGCRFCWNKHGLSLNGWVVFFVLLRGQSEVKRKLLGIKRKDDDIYIDAIDASVGKVLRNQTVAMDFFRHSIHFFGWWFAGPAHVDVGVYCHRIQYQHLLNRKWWCLLFGNPSHPPEATGFSCGLKPSLQTWKPQIYVWNHRKMQCRSWWKHYRFEVGPWFCQVMITTAGGIEEDAMTQMSSIWEHEDFLIRFLPWNLFATIGEFHLCCMFFPVFFLNQYTYILYIIYTVDWFPIIDLCFCSHKPKSICWVLVGKSRPKNSSPRLLSCRTSSNVWPQPTWEILVCKGWTCVGAASTA